MSAEVALFAQYLPVGQISIESTHFLYEIWAQYLYYVILFASLVFIFNSFAATSQYSNLSEIVEVDDEFPDELLFSIILNRQVRGSSR